MDWKSVGNWISDTLVKVDDFVWGPVMLVLLVGTGIFLTIRLKFRPWKNLGFAIKSTLSKEARTTKRGEGDVSPFSALTTALAATIGTGNIVGVATAMVSGGPGALVWMWISACFGLTSKFSECMLAIKYREVNEKGEMSGGPMYTMKKGFKKAIASMLSVKYDRSKPRPTVLIVGEYLLNFHPGANHDMELYLENNGLEIIEARMTDVIRKTYFYQRSQQREYKVHRPLPTKLNNSISDAFFKLAHDATDKIAKAHPLYTPPCRMPELVQASDPIIHHTFDAGEGVLIPAEILHHAKRGCRAFVILQPFGCLPNHVVGRGISKRLKELYPDAQILPLDFDPDVSFANIENRLQMLIMNARKPRTS